MGVHFIEKTSIYDLERAVDEFLHYTAHKVAEIQFAACANGNSRFYSAMIVYNKINGN